MIRQSILMMGMVTVVSLTVTASANVTRQYMLGDVDDGFYNGVGSIDDVYVGPEFMALILNDFSPLTHHRIEGFDIENDDHLIPFTFLYDLSYQEEIVGASLTLRMKALGGQPGGINTDVVYVDSTTFPGGFDDAFGGNPSSRLYSFDDLGWLPFPMPDYVNKTLDLGNILGDNLVASLQDGQLNMLLHDDVSIDYAVLSLDVAVIPAPSAILLGSIGVSCVTWLRRRRTL